MAEAFVVYIWRYGLRGEVVEYPSEIRDGLVSRTQVVILIRDRQLTCNGHCSFVR